MSYGSTTTHSRAHWFSILACKRSYQWATFWHEKWHLVFWNHFDRDGTGSSSILRYSPSASDIHNKGEGCRASERWGETFCWAEGSHTAMHCPQSRASTFCKRPAHSTLLVLLPFFLFFFFFSFTDFIMQHVFLSNGCSALEIGLLVRKWRKQESSENHNGWYWHCSLFIFSWQAAMLFRKCKKSGVGCVTLNCTSFNNLKETRDGVKKWILKFS